MCIKRSGTKVWRPTPLTPANRLLYAISTTTPKPQPQSQLQGEQFPFTFHNCDGIAVLGAPIGNAVHTSKVLREGVTKTANHPELLIEIGDAYIAFTLARMYFSTCRLNHLVRWLRKVTRSKK